MILVDTNVILDVLQDDPTWADWSVEQLSEARIEGKVVVNAIIVAELSRDYADSESLSSALSPFALRMEPIGMEAAFLAGKRFVGARANRPKATPGRPLPDFFIGAHALALDAKLLTRDPAIYRTHFPDVTLITPETHS